MILERFSLPHEMVQNSQNDKLSAPDGLLMLTTVVHQACPNDSFVPDARDPDPSLSLRGQFSISRSGQSANRSRPLSNWLLAVPVGSGGNHIGQPLFNGCQYMSADLTPDGFLIHVSEQLSCREKWFRTQVECSYLRFDQGSKLYFAH